MKKAITGLIAVIVVLVIVAGVYVITLPPTPTPTPTKKIKVAMIMSSPLNDYCWNAAAWEGMVYIRDELGVEIAYSEMVAVADYERVIREYADAGYDLILGHGFDTGDALQAVAPDYPNTAFAWADGYITAPNLACYACFGHESGYLAGILAAGMSKTGTIGAQGGMPVPDVVRVIEAYKLGAKAFNPNITVLDTYIGSWVDTGKSKEAALAMVDAGADILLHSSSAAGLGAIDVGKTRGIYIIGDTADQNVLAPNTIITSVLMIFKTPIVAMGQDVAAGTFEGKFYNFSMIDGGSDIAPYHGLDAVIPQNLKDKINEAKADIIAGRLEVPNIEELPE